VRDGRGNQREGKRVDFKVSASDGIEEIGNGTHQRIVIDLRSFNERLAKKRMLLNETVGLTLRASS